MLKEKYISVAGKDKRTLSKTVLRISWLGCCGREGGRGELGWVGGLAGVEFVE